MKENKLAIRINKPASEVFEFVTNPANTPKWIDFITKEQANESPPKLGTIYKNQNKAGEWSDYEVTAFEQNKMFVMSRRNNGYHVKYTIMELGDGITDLEYYEWMASGELGEPFTMSPLQKLKTILEKPA